MKPRAAIVIDQGVFDSTESAPSDVAVVVAANEGGGPPCNGYSDHLLELGSFPYRDEVPAVETGWLTIVCLSGDGRTRYDLRVSSADGEVLLEGTVDPDEVTERLAAPLPSANAEPAGVISAEPYGIVFEPLPGAAPGPYDIEVIISGTSYARQIMIEESSDPRLTTEFGSDFPSAPDDELHFLLLGFDPNELVRLVLYSTERDGEFPGLYYFRSTFEVGVGEDGSSWLSITRPPSDSKVSCWHLLAVSPELGVAWQESKAATPSMESFDSVLVECFFSTVVTATSD